uniref:CAZy families GT2/GT4 protein n=1 Tax=uncultured Saccharopolyspora sp. TaxID=498730 RepID=A0A060C2J2_9PSEU|nr:CAZy families GT2/GT4 protein [uncultured Saccharopolyspora sp.]
MSPIWSRIRLTVAPLRYGAGVKGKVGNSLRLGVPCVASSAAVEGMGLKPEREVLVADDPTCFAETMQRLYVDDRLWSAVSVAGKVAARQLFGEATARATLDYLCSGLMSRQGRPH